MNTHNKNNSEVEEDFAIDKIPDIDYFELEVLNKKEKILFKYGGYFSILIVLLFLLGVYLLFNKYDLL